MIRIRGVQRSGDAWATAWLYATLSNPRIEECEENRQYVKPSVDKMSFENLVALQYEEASSYSINFYNFIFGCLTAGAD